MEWDQQLADGQKISFIRNNDKSLKCMAYTVYVTNNTTKLEDQK